jgi:hypothetical protein
LPRLRIAARNNHKIESSGCSRVSERSGADRGARKVTWHIHEMEKSVDGSSPLTKIEYI